MLLPPLLLLNALFPPEDELPRLEYCEVEGRVPTLPEDGRDPVEG